MLRNKEYVQIAKEVCDECHFSYIGPRGMLIAQCARYLKRKHKEYPHWHKGHLYVAAKHLFIAENNRAYYRR